MPKIRQKQPDVLVINKFLRDVRIKNCKRPRSNSISTILSVPVEHGSKHGDGNHTDKKLLFNADFELNQICKTLKSNIEDLLEDLKCLKPRVQSRSEIVLKTKQFTEVLSAISSINDIIQDDVSKFQQKYGIKFDYLNEDLDTINANFIDFNEDCSDHSRSFLSADTQVLDCSQKTIEVKTIPKCFIKRDGTTNSWLSLAKKSCSYTAVSLSPETDNVLSSPVYNNEATLVETVENIESSKECSSNDADEQDELKLLRSIREAKESDSLSNESDLSDFKFNLLLPRKRRRIISSSLSSAEIDRPTIGRECKVVIGEKEKAVCELFDGRNYKKIMEFLRKSKKKKSIKRISSSSSSSSASTIFDYNDANNSVHSEEYADADQFMKHVHDDYNNRSAAILAEDDVRLESESEAENNDLLNCLISDKSSIEDSSSSSEGFKPNINNNNNKRTSKPDDSTEEFEEKVPVLKVRKRRPDWMNDSLLMEKLDDDDPKKRNSTRNGTGKAESVHSDSSDSIVFFEPNKIKTPPPPLKDDSSQELSCSQGKKGRRNIRDIISEDTLDINTQIATREEQERIERLKERQDLLKILNGVPDDSFVLDASDEQNIISVDNGLTQILKGHQKKGISFLWDNCYESVETIRYSHGNGCILAHCMGLGKTLQVITLVHTLFANKDATKTERVLIVVPLSTVLNWENEFKMAFAKAINKLRELRIFMIRQSDNKVMQRTQIAREWHRLGGVLIVGYECFIAMMKKHEELLVSAPDLVVCDEGHLLKNRKTDRTKTLMKIKTRRRIVLTGTPMQNNLKEYYYMIQFVKPNFLGTWKEFSNRFVNPITNGQYDDSSNRDIYIMKKRSHVLHKMTQNFIQRYEEAELLQYLPSRHEYVLMCQLRPIQVDLYKQQMLNCKPEDMLFANYCLLRLIWTHPSMLVIQEQRTALAASKNNRKSLQNKHNQENSRIISIDQEDNEERALLAVNSDNKWWKSLLPADVLTNPVYGTKFIVMMNIIEECIKLNEKLLIFSSSMAELDSIETMLKHILNWRHEQNYYRMDGNVPLNTRNAYCNSFNKQFNSIRAFLLSSRVGSLGLNLVAASRVIIMDVSWNPTLDSQSVFRVYRFGQKKSCYIYRLVSLGTMEEVMYERAVTKQAIAGRVVDEMQINRHYKASDIQAMYRNKVDIVKERPLPKLPADQVLANILSANDSIYSYHEHNDLLQNLPGEELDEEQMRQAWEEYEKEKLEPVQQIVQENQSSPPPPPIVLNGVFRVPKSPFEHKMLLEGKQGNAFVPIDYDDEGEPIVPAGQEFTSTQMRRAKELYEALNKLGRNRLLPKTHYIKRDGKYNHMDMLNYLNNVLKPRELGESSVPVNGNTSSTNNTTPNQVIDLAADE